jgi:hypothetical protein
VRIVTHILVPKKTNLLCRELDPHFCSSLEMQILDLFQLYFILYSVLRVQGTWYLYLVAHVLEYMNGIYLLCICGTAQRTMHVRRW